MDMSGIAILPRACSGFCASLPGRLHRFSAAGLQGWTAFQQLAFKEGWTSFQQLAFRIVLHGLLGESRKMSLGKVSLAWN